MREDNDGPQQEGTVEKEKESEVLLPEKWLGFGSGSYYRIHPDDKRNEIFEIDEGSLTPMTYCINNNVIARVDGRGRLLISPTGLIDTEALKAAGYTESAFKVPLSHGEVPDPMVQQWRTMKWNADHPL